MENKLMSKNLLKEAIADARAVKEAALANAKAALEEAITPKLQSMISARLQEMDNDDELDEAENPEDLDENENQDDLDEDIDLGLDENEYEEDGDNDEDNMGYDESDESTEDTDGMDSEGLKISDLTIDEFKEIIRDVVSQEMGGGEGEHDELGGKDEFGGEEDHDMGEEGPEDEDVNLDELLAELDSINENDDDELDESKEFESKAKGRITAVKGGPTKITAKGGNPGTGATGFKSVGNVTESKNKSNYNKAIKTIKTLRKDLNEVNLLNAKLLYVNKLFKSSTLNENQKLYVIESFDKATNTKEAKLVYETLRESLFKKKLKTGKKNPIIEHLGFASKPVGNSTKQSSIVEDATVARFQKLAGLK